MSGANIFNISTKILKPEEGSNGRMIRIPTPKKTCKRAIIQLSDSQFFLPIGSQQRRCSKNQIQIVKKKKQQIQALSTQRSSQSFRSQNTEIKPIETYNSFEIQKKKDKKQERPQSAAIKKIRKKSWDHTIKKLTTFQQNEFLFKISDRQNSGKNPLFIVYCKRTNKFVKLTENKINDEEWEPVLNQYTVKIFGKIYLQNKLYFVVENYSNSIRDTILAFGFLKERLVRNQIKDILCGIIHFHSRGIFHNRINPDNVYQNNEGRILIDITCASDKAPTQDEKTKYFHFLSPEQLNNDQITALTDKWAIGCLTLYMLTGNVKTNLLHPYNRQNEQRFQKIKKQREKYVKQKIRTDQVQVEGISREARKFIFECFQIKKQEKLELSLLIESHFFQNSL